MSHIAIVGGGPAATSTALSLLKQGIKSVTLIEKARFPRFRIGESLTGECGAALRALDLQGDMTSLKYPIKKGVKVFGPKGKSGFWIPVMGRQGDELVDGWTWQVKRSSFDKLLLDTACQRGAEMVLAEATTPIVEGGVVRGVRVRRGENAYEDIMADVVVDASGPSTFMARNGLTSTKQRANYDNQIAIFSQFKGAIREGGASPDDTLIMYRAPHHWAWFIPIDAEVVSVGIVVPKDYFAASQLSPEAFFDREARSLNAALTERLPAGCERVAEVSTASNYSYCIDRFTGPGFLCVGDAHRFIDPVFSFGVFFAIKEGQFAAQAIAEYLAVQGQQADRNPFEDYQRRCTQGMDVIQDMLDGFWQQPLAFGVMAHREFVTDFIDIFAGRIYRDSAYPGLTALRQMLGRVR